MFIAATAKGGMREKIDRKAIPAVRSRILGERITVQIFLERKGS